jgi:hypothetical protein
MAIEHPMADPKLEVTTPCSCGHMAILHDRATGVGADVVLLRCTKCTRCPAFTMAVDPRLDANRAVLSRYV